MSWPTRAQKPLQKTGLLEQFDVRPVARITMPGLTRQQISEFKVACNTHENGLTAASWRHYVDKDVEWRYKTKRRGDQLLQQDRKPHRNHQASRRHRLQTPHQHADGDRRRHHQKGDVEAVEIPEAEIVGEMHGKSMFPIHKMIDEIKPNSFNAAMADNYFDSNSGASMPKVPMCKSFVKPNEVLRLK